MSVTAAARSIKVGDWLIEPELLQISKDGEVRRLEFRTMEILLCLVSNRGEVVSKKKLHDEVWGEVHVTANSLTRGISRLRKTFDDDPLYPKYIDTISKSGYRLVAPVIFAADHVIGRDNTPPLIWSDTQNWRWMWGLLALIVLLGIVLMSISPVDVYSQFHDPVPVSTLVGPERGLAISPDGEKISFSYSLPGANNADVYIKLLDDLSQVQFTNLPSHQGYGIWSPDGNYMAYVSVEDSTCGIYKKPSIGGTKTRIGDCFMQPEDFVWSPDGRTIAFTDKKSSQEPRTIFFLDVASQVVTEITSPESGSQDRDPAFSPNGDHLVFRRVSRGRGDVYKMRLSDQKLTRITFDNARMLGLDIFDSGKQIAYSSNRGGSWALWKVPFNRGAITRFHISDRVPTEPRFSADGKRMVYKSVQDQTMIWAIENKESGPTAATPVAPSSRVDMNPSLSSDGKKVVFISNRSGKFEIWSNSFEHNNPTKLTSLEGSFVNMPSWSPDDSEIVFDARIDKNNAIYILDVASNMVRTFADLTGDQVNAKYSKDGKSIYFASNHAGTWQIWKKPLFDNNLNIEQVTQNGGYYLQEGPDNEYLYYARFDTSGIWRINVSENSAEEQVVSALGDFDWGNWVPVREGILYIDQTAGALYRQSYNSAKGPDSLFTTAKPIQRWNSSLSATFDEKKIIFVQIENNEDEIMLVDFR